MVIAICECIGWNKIKKNMERLKEKKKNKMGKINDILMINKIRDWINQKILGNSMNN